MTSNERAFLSMLRHSEGTDRAPNPYAVCYGYRYTITDFSKHPAAEPATWHGESLASLGPKYANEVSTAAGAYQLILPTWLSVASRARLKDFTPASQDAAALWLIGERGALGLVNAGNIEMAISLLHPVWASLPGSTADQPQTTLAALSLAYVRAGGVA